MISGLVVLSMTQPKPGFVFSFPTVFPISFHFPARPTLSLMHFICHHWCCSSHILVEKIDENELAILPQYCFSSPSVDICHGTQGDIGVNIHCSYPSSSVLRQFNGDDNTSQGGRTCSPCHSMAPTGTPTTCLGEGDAYGGFVLTRYQNWGIVFVYIEWS
jgi:hypothetical protein